MRILLIAILLLSAPGLRAQPVVGDIFDTDVGKEFRGWQLTADAIGEFKQSYSVFESGNQILIALTSPVTRTDRGGIDVRRITKIQRVVIPAGEQRESGDDCGFLSLTPAIAHLNTKTKIATGFFVLTDAIEIRRWVVDDPTLCTYGGD
jgi:hypothetical protein